MLFQDREPSVFRNEKSKHGFPNENAMIEELRQFDTPGSFVQETGMLLWPPNNIFAT